MMDVLYKNTNKEYDDDDDDDDDTDDDDNDNDDYNRKVLHESVDNRLQLVICLH